MRSYIISQFITRKARTLSVIVGIAIGMGLFLALTALGNGYQEAARLPLVGVASDVIINKQLKSNDSAMQTKTIRGVRMPFGVSTITTNEIEEIKENKNVEAVAPVLQLWDFGPTSYKTILGIDPEETSVGPGHALQDGIIKGRTIKAGEREVVLVDRHYSMFFRIQPGKEIQIGNKTFQVIGVIEQANTNQTTAANLYISIEDARELVGLKKNEVNQLYIRVANSDDVEGFIQELTNTSPQLIAISEDSLVQVMGGIGQISARFAVVAAAIGLIGGLLLAWFALSGMINERQKEIAIMKAVGWSQKSIIKAFITESLLLSLLGGTLGVAIGLFCAWALQQVPSPDFGTALSGVNDSLPHLQENTAHSEETATLPVRIDLQMLLVALFTVTLASVTAVLYGVWKVIKMKPAQLLRQR